MNEKFIAEALRNNNLKIGNLAQFERLQETGFVSEMCKNAEDDAVNLMGEILKYGINFGFDDCADALDRLVSVCINLTKNNAMKRIKDFNKEISNQREVLNKLIVKNSNALKERENKMINEVKQYIQSSLDAIPLLLSNNPRLASQLQASVEKFSAMLEEIDNVQDVTTKDAAAIATQIVNHIKEWRKSANSNMLTNEQLKSLDSALDGINQWSKLTNAAVTKRLGRKGNIASDDDLAGVKYVEDQISRTAYCSKFLSQLAIFKDNLNGFSDKINNNPLIKSKQEELDKVNAEINKLAEAYRDGKTKYDQGKLSKSAYESLLTNIKMRKNPLDIRKSRITIDIKNLNTSNEIKRGVLDLLNRISYELDSLVDNPAALAVAAKIIKFDAMNNAMTGATSAQDQRNLGDVLATIAKIKEKILTNSIGMVTEGTTLLNESDIALQQVYDQANQQLNENLQNMLGAQQGNTQTVDIASLEADLGFDDPISEPVQNTDLQDPQQQETNDNDPFRLSDDIL